MFDPGGINRERLPGRNHARAKRSRLKPFPPSPSPDAMRTRVKFCGITRDEDAQAAAALGADAIGLIFAATSPRRLEVPAAADIARALPPLVSKVALFMDPPIKLVELVIVAVRPDVLQFHGSEDADFCGAFRRPYIKAVPMMDVEDVRAYTARFPNAAGFVLDSHRAGAAGGTGLRFDWSRISGGVGKPLILAGGLDPDNVGDAIARVRPYAVDVSSGIESAPGIKDYAKMTAFLDEVRRAGG
jgi:phosphoribosylanthranilate isomerase